MGGLRRGSSGGSGGAVGAGRRDSKSSMLSPRSSSSSLDTSDLLREAFLFIFSDLFLFCRPCRTLGRKGQLDVYMDCAPDRVRAKPGNLMDSIKMRVLRDAGPGLPPTKFLFQCKLRIVLRSLLVYWIVIFFSKGFFFFGLCFFELLTCRGKRTCWSRKAG